MAIMVAFNLMKIVDISEDSNRKEVPQVGNVREEPVRIAVAVAFKRFQQKKYGAWIPLLYHVVGEAGEKGSSEQLSYEYLSKSQRKATLRFLERDRHRDSKSGSIKLEFLLGIFQELRDSQQ